MKPNFALYLNHDGLELFHRSPEGWEQVGLVPLDAEDLGGELARLRAAGEALAPEGMTTKLLIPDSQILYTDLTLEEDPAPAGNGQPPSAAIRAALAGRTPYPPEELVYDWRALDDGRLRVAVVARETLHEAEAFAREHRFNPVSLAGTPRHEQFPGEPSFGATASAEALLARLGALERDSEPVLAEAPGRELPVAEVHAPDPARPQREAPQTEAPQADAAQRAPSAAQAAPAVEASTGAAHTARPDHAAGPAASTASATRDSAQPDAALPTHRSPGPGSPNPTLVAPGALEPDTPAPDSREVVLATPAAAESVMQGLPPATDAAEAETETEAETAARKPEPSPPIASEKPVDSEPGVQGRESPPAAAAEVGSTPTSGAAAAPGSTTDSGAATNSGAPAGTGAVAGALATASSPAARTSGPGAGTGPAGAPSAAAENESPKAAPEAVTPHPPAAPRSQTAGTPLPNEAGAPRAPQAAAREKPPPSASGVAQAEARGTGDGSAPAPKPGGTPDLPVRAVQSAALPPRSDAADTRTGASEAGAARAAASEADAATTLSAAPQPQQRQDEPQPARAVGAPPPRAGRGPATMRARPDGGGTKVPASAPEAGERNAASAEGAKSRRWDKQAGKRLRKAAARLHAIRTARGATRDTPPPLPEAASTPPPRTPDAPPLPDGAAIKMAATGAGSPSAPTSDTVPDAASPPRPPSGGAGVAAASPTVSAAGAPLLAPMPRRLRAALQAVRPRVDGGEVSTPALLALEEAPPARLPPMPPRLRQALRAARESAPLPPPAAVAEDEAPASPSVAAPAPAPPAATAPFLRTPQAAAPLRPIRLAPILAGLTLLVLLAAATLWAALMRDSGPVVADAPVDLVAPQAPAGATSEAAATAEAGIADVAAFDEAGFEGSLAPAPDLSEPLAPAPAAEETEASAEPARPQTAAEADAEADTASAVALPEEGAPAGKDEEADEGEEAADLAAAGAAALPPARDEGERVPAAAATGPETPALPEDPVTELVATDDGAAERVAEQLAAALTPEIARRAYDETGVWVLPPGAPSDVVPGAATEAADDLQLAATDPALALEELAAPQAAGQDQGLAPQLPPPPAGTSYDLGPDGLVRATPEGALSPDGVLVTAGPPSAVPPARPGAAPTDSAQASDEQAAAADAREKSGASADEAPEPDGAAALPMADPPPPSTPPRARPAGLAPAEQDARLPAPLAGDAAEEEQQAALTPASLDAAPTLTPRPRPETVAQAAVASRDLLAEQQREMGAAADAAVGEAVAAFAASPLAVASSRLPRARPSDLETVVAAAAPPPAAAAQPATPAPGAEVPEADGEAEVAAAAMPALPTRPDVAKAATISRGMKLGKVNLIGVFGTPNQRRALVMLNGRKYVRVGVGDRLDGGRVAAISDAQLIYVKGGKQLRLDMPKN